MKAADPESGNSPEVHRIAKVVSNGASPQRWVGFLCDPHPAADKGLITTTGRWAVQDLATMPPDPRA